MRSLVLAVLIVALMPMSATAETARRTVVQWKFTTQDNKDFAKPDFDDSSWQSVSVGSKWKSSKFAWFRGAVTIPADIGGKSTVGEAVALQWNACDGGECFVNGKIYTRYDNDHPALVVLSTDAKPGQVVPVAIRVFMGPDDSEKDGSLGQADLVIVDPKLIKTAFNISVDPGNRQGEFPKSFAGVSQGAGLPDYDDATVAALKSVGIRWFRMDNILTNALKKNADGTTSYDWTDIDKRLDFMAKVGCEPIFCISYMPEALDAVPNP